MRCTCGHVFSGQVVNRGKLKKDGSRIRNYYYLCGGYRDKGRHVCVKAQLSRDAIEREVLSRIRARVDEFLDGGGEEILRTLLSKSLKAKSSESKVQVQNGKQRIREIDHDIDRLLDSLTPEIKDVISKKITELKKEQAGLRTQLDEAAARPSQETDIDSLADDIIERIRCFEDVFKEGTIEEKKEFVSLFVDGIDVDPHAKTLKMHIRRFPAPESLDTGNLSFRMVAGARCEDQKIRFPPVDVVEVPLVCRGRGATLVPVGT